MALCPSVCSSQVAAQPITVVCKATRVYMPILGGVVWTFYHLLCKNGWTDRRQSLKPTPIHAKCCWWTVGWHRSLIIYWLAAKFLLGHNYEFTMHWLRRRVVSFVCERVALTFSTTCCSHGRLLDVLCHRTSWIPVRPKASSPLDHYQIIVFGDRGTCVWTTCPSYCNTITGIAVIALL